MKLLCCTHIKRLTRREWKMLAKEALIEYKRFEAEHKLKVFRRRLMDFDKLKIDIGKVAKEHPEIIRDEIDKMILNEIRALAEVQPIPDMDVSKISFPRIEAKDIVPKVHKRKDGLIIE